MRFFRQLKLNYFACVKTMSIIVIVCWGIFSTTSCSRILMYVAQFFFLTGHLEIALLLMMD